jgi:hypothetical protein
VLTFARGFDAEEFAKQARELGEYVGSTTRRAERWLIRIEASLCDISERLVRIEGRLAQLKTVEAAKAICDNCKIEILLQGRSVEKAADYIQNLGWSLRDEQTLCPGCTRRREEDAA